MYNPNSVVQAMLDHEDVYKRQEFCVEDSAFGFIRMKNGAVIELEAAWALNTQMCIRDRMNTRWIFNDSEFNRLYELTRGVELSLIHI